MRLQNNFFPPAPRAGFLVSSAYITACVAFTAWLPPLSLRAADLTYDVVPSTADIDGGAANWSDANWKTSAGATTGGAWTANDSAIFDAIVGSPTTTTITLGGTETATAVTFNGAGYTLTGGTLALAGTGGGNWITMNADGTIASALSVMRFKGSAEATISGGGALGSNRIVLGDSDGTAVTVRQTAGAITTSDYMMIGGNNVANASGSYIMDGGSLTVSQGAYFGWGAATSSGTFTQNGGTVTIGGQGLQLGIGGGSGTYILNGGTLDSRIGNESLAGSFTFGGGTFKAASGFTATTQRVASSTIASGATAIIETNGQTVTWERELTGPQAAGLTKSGFGTLILNGNFTGDTRVERGLLQVNSATSLGTGTVTIPDVPVGTLASHGGSIDLNGFSFSNDFFIGNRSSGPADIGALGNRKAGTTSVLSGDIHIGGENYGGGDGSIRFDGLISGGVVTHYSMYKQNAGTWTFTNEANTFEGFWYQDGGSTTEVTKLANINQPSSLGQPTTSFHNRVVFNSAGGRIRYIGSSASTSDREFVAQGTTNRVDASGTVAAATLTLTGNVTGGSGRTFALGGESAGVNVYAGTIGNGTNLALLKDGSTTWRLTGSNTYSGATTVAAGRLEVNGSLGGTPMTVQNGGTLGGSGTIGGAVAVQGGGTLGPGNSIESLRAGATSFASAATFAYEVDSTTPGSLGTAADLLVVDGNLDIASGSILTFTDLAASPNPFVAGSTVFALINYSGTWNTGFFTYASNILADGGQFRVGSQWWEIDYNSPTGGDNYTGDYLPSSSFVTVTAIAVPEPATLVLLAVAAGLALLRRARCPSPLS